jgi:hypothetical protein
VLGEDDQHLRFARHALLGLAFHTREIRCLFLPAGRGAGDQYVRAHYAAEVREHRRKASSQQVALFVLTDADTQPVEHRFAQLAGVLQEAELAARKDREAIIIWVPKRNIETWVTYLAGQTVNEGDDFKRAGASLDVRASAERFALLIQDATQRRDDTPPSMARAFDEAKRLPRRK